MSSVEMGSRTINAKRNIKGAFIYRVTGMLMPFLTRTVMIYYLGTLYLGLNSLFTSVLQVLSLAELGFGEAMVFSMYEPIAKGDTEMVCALLKLYRTIYRVIGVVIVVLGLVFMPFIPNIINGEVPQNVNLYALYLINLLNTGISYFLFAYRGSLLTANQRSDITSKIGTIICCGTSLTQIFVLILFRNYYLYCLVMPLFQIISNMLAFFATKKMYPQYKCSGKVRESMMKDIRKRVTGLFIYKVCAVFRNSFDSIIISAFLGLTILAKYNNYYYIMKSITTFVVILIDSITAGVGNSIAIDTQEKNYNDFEKFQLLYLWVGGFCTTCLCCLYQPFMNLWVGKDLMFESSTMLLFGVYFFTMKTGDLCFAYRQAAGLWWHDKFRPLIEAVTNLTLNIVLVKFIGIAGVLLSTILCQIFINTAWGSKVLFKYYFTKYKQGHYIFRLLYFSSVTIFSCVLSLAVCNEIAPFSLAEISKEMSAIVFFVRGIVCMVVPNIIMLLMYRRLPEFTDSVVFIKRLIWKKKH